ncbi:MAG: enolase C-terminal domain-like protein [Bacteriovoracales bacterium]
MNHFFVDASIRPYTISFKRPLSFGPVKHNFKKGHFLVLRDNFSNIVMGELPFLEGLHSGDPGKNLEILEKISLDILNKEIDLKNLNFRKNAFNLFPIDQEGLPLFCIEGALLSWLEKVDRKQVNNFFQGNSKNPVGVPVNGLLIPTQKEDPKELVENWKRKGFKTIKIKIGNLPINEELNLIWGIFKEAKNSLKIRLDGNQKFSGEDFFFFAKNLPVEFVDYIEDPIKDIKLLEKIHEETKLSFAFEESLIKGNFKKEKYLKAWIIKPSIFGGLSKSIQIIDKAHDQGLIAVISSAYESKMGLKQLTSLATYQNRFQKTDCGLNTFDNFIDDDSLENPKLEKGILSFS